MERYNKIENAECFKFFENLFLLIYVSSSFHCMLGHAQIIKIVFSFFFKIQPLFLTPDIFVQVNLLKKCK